MPDGPKNSQQQTEQTPTGYTVPVPRRDEFFGNLKKAAKPEPSTATMPERPDGDKAIPEPFDEDV